MENAETVTCDNENIGLIRWHTAMNIKGKVVNIDNFFKKTKSRIWATRATPGGSGWRSDKTKKKKCSGKTKLQLVHRIDFRNKSREANNREFKDCQGKQQGAAFLTHPMLPS